MVPHILHYKKIAEVDVTLGEGEEKKQKNMYLKKHVTSYRESISAHRQTVGAPHRQHLDTSLLHWCSYCFAGTNKELQNTQESIFGQKHLTHIMIIWPLPPHDSLLLFIKLELCGWERAHSLFLADDGSHSTSVYI